MNRQQVSRDELLWETCYMDFTEVCSESRTKELFEWLFGIYSNYFLSSVDPQYVSTLADVKTSLAIVDAAMDDACDNASLIANNGGEELSRSILGLLYNFDKKGIDIAIKSEPVNSIQENQGKYYKVVKDITEKSIDFCRKRLPRFNEFNNEFTLAMRYVICSNEFCHCVNTSKIIYPFSFIVKARSPATMVVVHSIMDLMCSPGFDRKELGKAIPLFTMADTVAMLSNTIATWSREILERDYTSPVLALALERGLIEFGDFEICDAHEFETRLCALPIVIEDEIDKVIFKMQEYAMQVEIHGFNAVEFIDICSEVKEAFKIREKMWPESPDGCSTTRAAR